jgi:NitT/TauT family transport system substrate-binding protein
MPLTPDDCNLQRRAFLAGMAALLLLPGLPGCRSKAPLTIAAHIWPGYELLFLARREGWLPSGIALLETAAATDSLQALEKGTAHAAALTLDEVLLARSKGIPLTVVLVFDVSAGADMVMVRPGINSPAGLANRRIGVEDTALGAYVLHLVLQQAGLARSQVTTVSITPDKQVAAWQQGAFDAAITYHPTANHLEKAGMVPLIDSRKMPGAILDVLAIRTDLLPRFRPQLCQAVAAHFKALHHLKSNPQDAAHRMAARLKTSADEVLAGFRGLNLPSVTENRRYLAGDNPLLRETARTLLQVMQSTQLLKSTDSLKDLADPACLPLHENEVAP